VGPAAPIADRQDLGVAQGDLAAQVLIQDPGGQPAGLPSDAYEPRLGYFSVRDDSDFYYASPTEDTYNTFDGDITYIGATVPTIPADPADPTGWPSEIESNVVDVLAEYLRGAKVVL
jgi:hypothetical protein